MNKPKFLSNFWAGFRKVLGSKHEIQDLKKCDFTPIYDHLMAEREAKKTQPKEVGQTSNHCSDSSRVCSARALSIQTHDRPLGFCRWPGEKWHMVASWCSSSMHHC